MLDAEVGTPPGPEPMKRFGFIGFGEAGSALAGGLIDAGSGPVVAYDIAHETSELVRRRADDLEVELVPHPRHVVEQTEVIVSAVVCTEASVAARSVAPSVTDRHWYLDINSVAPGVKHEAAALLERSGCRYIDLAVMSNVSRDIATLPLLGAGRHAEALPDLFPPLELTYEVVSRAPGDAARIKMFRSLFVKGLEALALESMLGSYASGMHDRVLRSLDVTFGNYTFSELVQHLIARHAVHGKRRASELEEVANSLREMGIDPIMAEAGFSRMSWDVERGLQDRFAQGGDPDWLDVLAELELLRNSGEQLDG